MATPSEQDEEKDTIMYATAEELLRQQSKEAADFGDDDDDDDDDRKMPAAATKRVRAAGSTAKDVAGFEEDDDRKMPAAAGAKRVRAAGSTAKDAAGFEEDDDRKMPAAAAAAAKRDRSADSTIAATNRGASSPAAAPEREGLSGGTTTEIELIRAAIAATAALPAGAFSSQHPKKAIASRCQLQHTTSSTSTPQPEFGEDFPGQKKQRPPAARKGPDAPDRIPDREICKRPPEESSACCGGAAAADEDEDEDEQLRRAVVGYCTDKIPAGDRAALDEALEGAPDIVRRESDPARYARLESGNVGTAASRLAAYWSFRRRCFGEHRFLLPIDLSGNGALEEEDVAVLRAGHMTFLPRSASGHNVLFIDYDQIYLATQQQQLGRDAHLHRFRAFFYVLTAASQDDRPVMILRLWGSPKWENGRAQKVMQMLAAMPLKLVSFISLFKPPPGASRLFKETIVPLYNEFISTCAFYWEYHDFLGNSPRDFLEYMKQHGCSEEGLPTQVGGALASEREFTKWFDARRELEGSGVADTKSQQATAVDQKPFAKVDTGTAKKASSQPPKKAIASRCQLQHTTSSSSPPPGGGEDPPGQEKKRPPARKRPPKESSVCCAAAAAVNDEDEDEQLRRAVLRYCADKIPAGDRAALDEALQGAPDIVRCESDPARYARLESGNVGAAAARLVAYWSFRKGIFGEHRFLLPIDLSGNGALEEEDVAMVRAGHVAFLPRSASGRNVVFFNYDQVHLASKQLGRDAAHSALRRFRAFFYMATVTSQDDRPGMLVRLWSSPKWDKGKSQKMLRMLAAMPIDLVSFVVLFKPPPGASRLFKETIMPLFKELVTTLDLPWEYHDFLGNSDFLEYMKKQGCSEGGLPTQVGGVLASEREFAKWFDTRCELERSGIATKSQQTTAVDQKPFAKVGTGTAKKAEGTPRKRTSLAERKERKRMMDQKYASNRRNRAKEEEVDLREQTRELTRSNLYLRQEERRLVSLMVEAEATVRRLEAPDGPYCAAATIGSAASAKAEAIGMDVESNQSAYKMSSYTPASNAACIGVRLDSESREAQLLSLLRSHQKPIDGSFATFMQPPPPLIANETDGLLSQALIRSLLEKNGIRAAPPPAAMGMNLSQFSTTVGQPSELQKLLHGLRSSQTNLPTFLPAPMAATGPSSSATDDLLRRALLLGAPLPLDSHQQLALARLLDDLRRNNPSGAPNFDS